MIAPSEIPEINYNMLEEELDTLIPRKFVIDNDIKMRIPSEYTELLIKNATNGKHVGSGNRAMDVIVNKKGIDVSLLSLKNTWTNEKSVIQNFKTGCKMDDLFNNKNEGQIKNIMCTALMNKFKEIKLQYKLEQLYYAIFITTNNKIYLSTYVINIDEIDNIESSNFSEEGKSLKLGGVINKQYGKSTIYQNKKRIELKFSSDILNINNTRLVYDLHNPFNK